MGNRIAGLCAAAAAAVLGTAMVSTPAHADHANREVYGASFVDGAGSYTDDFGEHYSELGHYLCSGCADSWNTDLVVMWQAILYAEGLLHWYEVDGKFGSVTANATARWQSAHGLAADGLVGPATWRRADGQLRKIVVGFVGYQAGDTLNAVMFCRGDCSEDGSGGAYQLREAYRPGEGWLKFDNTGHRVNFYVRTLSITR